MTESDRNPSVLEGDEMLLGELLRGVSLVQAAKTAGLSESTARRRKADPEFQARLDEGRAQTLSLLAVRATADVESIAWPALAEIAANKDAKSADRISAAHRMIAYAIALAESRDLESRIERLERDAGVNPITGQWKSAA
jgi:hypothetical protein